MVLFVPNYKDAMMKIGESYPFFGGNFYLTIISKEFDQIREFATRKESKVVSAPESWLDLRIKGTQLSQNFRRKCKRSPKGLFSYPLFEWDPMLTALDLRGTPEFMACSP